MKRLSFLALLTGAFVFGLASLPTTYGGGGTADAGWRCKCCENKTCLTLTAVYSRDEFKAIALSNCLICTSQYRGNCNDD